MSRARNIAASYQTLTTVGATVAALPVFKIGDMIWSCRGAVPSGFLACDGAAVSRATYADLFAVIGTTHGAGDGVTTFNLPDARGRSAVGTGQGSGLTNRALGATGGAESHTLTEAQMPMHGHPFFASYATQSTANSTSTGGFMTNSGGTSARTAHTGRGVWNPRSTNRRHGRRRGAQQHAAVHRHELLYLHWRLIRG